MRNFAIYMVVFLFGATLVNIYLPVSSAQEKEAPPYTCTQGLAIEMVADDTYLCTHIHELPIDMHEAVISYCKGLMERGL